GQAELVLQALEGNSFFNGVKIFTLNVFDQRHGDGGFIRHIPDNGRYPVLTGDLTGTPATLTGNNLIAIVTNGTNHNGLHHPLLTDGVGELFQGSRIHIAPRLILAPLHQLHRELTQFAVGRATSSLVLDISPRTRQQRAETALPQTPFLSRHEYSYRFPDVL